MLARWVNERYPDRRRIFTSKTGPVAPFEPEVKRQAVMALCTRQISASEIARRIGVSRAVLINGKMKLSATVLTRLCVNITNLPGGRTRCIAGGSRPTESGNMPPTDGAGYSEKGGGNHKKDPGISISHLNNREKTKITDALRQTYPLTESLHVLGLARSSYFYHRAALKAGDKYARYVRC